MSTRNNQTEGSNRASTGPSYALNHDHDSENSEQGLSRNDNRYSFASDIVNREIARNKPSQEVTMESEDDELNFDYDALSKNQNRESFNYISEKIKRIHEGPPPEETIFRLLEDEDEHALFEFIKANPVDITKLRDPRGYTVLHIIAYKGLESM